MSVFHLFGLWTINEGGVEGSFIVFLVLRQDYGNECFEFERDGKSFL